MVSRLLGLLGFKFGDEDTEYLAANHGDAPPDVAGRDVIIVDFSYKRNVMCDMYYNAKSLRVLDHHKTAQADLEGLAFATFDMERSGAGIAWDVLHEGKPRPWLVDYVEDRDLWRFKLHESKTVHAWISAKSRDSFKEWSVLAGQDVDAMRERGVAVLAYIDKYVDEMCGQARTIEFEGYKVPIVNAPYVNISDVLNKLAEKAPLAVGWFQGADGKYKYSLRSNKDSDVDVSEIAKKYGGGGHKNAAGFLLETPL